MKVIESRPEEGRTWIERWLAVGHFVSKAVFATASFDHGHFRTCVTDEAASKPLPDFETGWVARRSEVYVWLGKLLDELALRGAKCLIVEDDLSIPSDPGLANESIPTAFIGDHVFSWSDINPGDGIDAVKRVMGVGSGYPTVAFVTTHSAADLGFSHCKQAPKDFPQKVAGSLLAVMVAIFDDETFLAWTPDEQDSATGSRT